MTARLYENSGRSIYSYIIASCADPDRRAPLAAEINMRTIDNINNKVNSLTTLFNTIDKVSTGVSYVTNTFVDKATSAISKIFRSKKKKEREEDIYE